MAIPYFERTFGTWRTAASGVVARRLACVLLLLALPATARAAWQSYRAALDGLADNWVLSVAEGDDGALWFGTINGVSRFDGTRWLTVRDSLPSQRVFSILQDSRGTWWFGTQSGGVAAFDGARWDVVDASDGRLPSNTVQSILEDHRGDLWFGTPNGLVRFEPPAARWTTIAAGPGALVSGNAYRLYEDHDRQLWIGTPQGLSRLDASRTAWTTFVESPGQMISDSILAIGEDAEGGVWVGTDKGASRFRDGAWHHVTTAEGLASAPVLSITRDSLGRMWFGGFTGFARWDAGTLRAESRTADGVVIGTVLALRADRSGNVWLGTATNGAFRYDGVAFRHYFADPAIGTPTCAEQPSPNIPFQRLLGSNCLTAMLKDGRGDLWFGTFDGGTSRLDRAGRWTLVRRTGTAPVSDSIAALAEDPAGGLWLGSQDAGIAVWDSARASWRLHRRADGLASDSVRTLFVDREGAVWAGTTNGASRWDGSSWTRHLYGGVDGASVEVQQFLEDSTRRLWIRSTAGLHSLDPPRTVLRRWTAADGLADDFPTAMLEDRSADLWFGTPGGLSRLSGTQWTTWTTLGGGAGGAIRSLHETPQGVIWAGTDFGAARWDGAAWESHSAVEIGGDPVTGIFTDPGGVVWLVHRLGLSRWNGSAFRTYDNRGNGLASNFVTGWIEDAQRRLWFASDGGLVEHESDRAAPQTVFVNTPARILPARTVSFVFGAGFGESADLEFSFAFDGGAFGPWVPDNTFTRSAIADGPHTFAVRARDWARNQDPAPATFDFEVDATPPAAQITEPGSGQPVRGVVAVAGEASDARFEAYLLQARPSGTASWSHPSVITLAASPAPVAGDTLALWPTTGLPDGGWDLRLSVTDTLGLVGLASVRVVVDNQAPFADVTSPARIVAAEGGDVFTTNAEVHLYFPPNGFDADAQVTIDTVAAAPDTLPEGAVRRGPAWNVGWTGGQLVKDGLIELQPPGGASGLAVWGDPGDGAWRRLGGSPQSPDGSLGLALVSAGAYALFAEAAAPAGAGGLGGLTLSLRAFSPRGSFAASDVAIGFTLARPGGVTVKVYNRAGRLVRMVANGIAGVTGANLVRWDGRDGDGSIVESGLYVVAVEALGETRTSTLAVVP